jgi:hypothetical protein
MQPLVKAGHARLARAPHALRRPLLLRLAEQHRGLRVAGVDVHRPADLRDDAAVRRTWRHESLSFNRKEIGALELAPARSQERQPRVLAGRHESGDWQARSRPHCRHRVHSSSCHAQLRADRRPLPAPQRRGTCRDWRIPGARPTPARSPGVISMGGFVGELPEPVGSGCEGAA